MKRLKFLLIAILFTSIASAGETSRQIRYHAPVANEVFMVWGINDWQLPENVKKIPDSFIKKSLVYTKMKKEGGDFVISISLPKTASLNFCFWITKGPFNTKMDLWDTNFNGDNKSYFLAGSENVGAYIVADPSVIKIREIISFTSYTGYLLIILMLVMLTHACIHWWLFKNKVWTFNNNVRFISSVVISLFVLTFPLRASITGSFWKMAIAPVETIITLPKEVFYDAVVLICLGIFFLGLAFLARDSVKKEKWIRISFCTCAGIYLLAEILNINVVQQLGTPFNYRWLSYSDFLKSTDARNAIQNNMGEHFIFETICTFVLIVPLVYLIYHFIKYISYRIKPVILTLFSGIILCSFFAFAAPGKENGQQYNKIANPLWAFLESLNPSASFLNKAINIKSDLAEKHNLQTVDLYAEKFKAHKIKNVLILVGESTAAEYIDLYNKKTQITPVLDALYNQSVVFENIYAHSPCTTKSLACLFCSFNPWLSFHSLTAVHPDVAQLSIAEVLQQKGYRTAFFNSGDNAFQNTGTFLQNHGFANITDFKNNNCGKLLKTGHDEWKNGDGSDDECLVDACLNWIDKEKARPFFTTLWTYQTHYPYFVTGQEKDYGVNGNSLNKYLNAVHHTDEVLGQLIEGLKKRGLYENTLIVFTGDHGEAFGRHEQTTHATRIYEENVHIPLVLINPQLFKGDWRTSIGAISDIAPTILNILETPSPTQWQGESLFSKNRRERVYFYAPWSDYWFGYREKQYKFLYNASNDYFEMFDLSKDPTEENNIATAHPASIEMARNRLAAWVQYQNQFMNSLINQKSKTVKTFTKR